MIPGWRNGPHPYECRADYLARIFEGKRYTLDDDPIPSMSAWCEDNEVEDGEAWWFASLAVGTPVPLGGGAAATFILRRVL